MDYEQRTGKRVFVRDEHLALRIVDAVPGQRVGISKAIEPNMAYVVNFDALFDLPKVTFEESY